MTIKYIGHACFLVTSDSGVRIVIDPYEPGAFGGALGYAPLTEAADIVLVTHDHADHNFVRGVLGSPRVCRQTCELDGIQFRVTTADHDEAGGHRRGTVSIFSFELDGVRLCHVGDLGVTLTQEQVASIGPVDVLMLPVGGTFTVDAQAAWQVAQQLRPGIVIPMHYKTPKVMLPLQPLEEFLRGKPNIERPNSSELTLTPQDCGSAAGTGDFAPRIIVLLPAN